MERVRARVSGFCRHMHAFGRSVVEWRSPATAPYLLVVNTAFWLSAIYLPAAQQTRVLVSLAAGVFGWDVLLSPSNDRSTLAHILLWPLQSIWRTAGVAGSLYSAQQLRSGLVVGEEMRVCAAAYATLGCLLVNPVWEYYDTNRRIMDGCKYGGGQVMKGVDYVVVQPLIKIYKAIKYVVTLQFIWPIVDAIRAAGAWVRSAVRGGWRGFLHACRNLIANIKQRFREGVVAPLRRFCSRVVEFCKYWFGAQWWPALKQWLKVKVGEPLQRGVDCTCYCVVYVVCLHWLPPLSRWLWEHTKRAAAWLNDKAVRPTKAWLRRKAEQAAVATRALLHRAALAIRDSILWPICVLAGECVYQLYCLAYATLLQPVIDYVYVRYKIVESAALIYILGPVCEKVINNIPEKSPFCDDSDVELEGLLPEEAMREASDVDDEEEEEMEAREKEQGIIEEDDLLPEEPLEHSEDDFVAGLAFPNVDHSESSDEEFDLYAPPRSSVRRRKAT